MKTLLIDGDIIAYHAAAGVQTAVQWDPTDDASWTFSGDAAEAKRRIDDRVRQWLVELNATAVIVCLSDAHRNWRKQVLASYKANRSGMKPVVYGAVREYLVEEYGAKVLPHLEADDLLGLYATSVKLKGPRVIVSEDKDLATVPGQRFNPRRPELGVVTTTVEQADRLHMMQAICGDATDNYKGLPGAGPVKAEKILGESTGRKMWTATVAAYKKAGLTQKDALVQARVSRILRRGEYNARTGKVTLWTPKLLEG